MGKTRKKFQADTLENNPICLFGNFSPTASRNFCNEIIFHWRNQLIK